MIDENEALPCRPPSDSRISDKHKVKIQRLQPDIAALGTVVDALDKLDEPQRLWVLQTAAARFSLRMQTEVLHAKPSVEKTGSSSASDIAQTQDNGERSPKTFIREKSPQSDVQRITCLAYYLTNFRGTPHFRTKQLTDLNAEAGNPKFSNATVAANNARRDKYLTPAGKGNKQLTNHGEDLVNALPDQEKVKALRSGTRSRSTRARKRRGALPRA